MSEDPKLLPIQERLPIAALALAREHANDVDSLMVALEFEFSEIEVSRADARRLIQLATNEQEADELASAPSGSEFLISKTDKMLREELTRLEEKQRVMILIANKPDGMDYLVKSTKEVISPEQARLRLDRILDRILIVKKSLSDDVKSKAKQGDTTLAFQLNMGDSLSHALGNIESRADEFPTVKQVESNTR